MSWQNILRKQNLSDEELLEYWEAQAFGDGGGHPADYIPALDDNMTAWAKQHGLTINSSNNEIDEAVEKSYIADTRRYDIGHGWNSYEIEQESDFDRVIDTITWKEFFDKGGYIQMMGGYDDLYDLIRMSLEDPMPLNEDGEEMGMHDIEDYLDYRKERGD